MANLVANTTTAHPLYPILPATSSSGTPNHRLSFAPSSPFDEIQDKDRKIITDQGRGSILSPEAKRPGSLANGQSQHEHDANSIPYIGAGISCAVVFFLTILIALPIALRLLKKKRYRRRYCAVPHAVERTMCAAFDTYDGNESDDEWRKLPTDHGVRLSMASGDEKEDPSGNDHDMIKNIQHETDSILNSVNENELPPLPPKPPDPTPEPQWQQVGDMIQRYINQFQTLKAQRQHNECLDSKVNFTCKNFAIGSFDQTGGFLELSDFDVSMYVPPGALTSKSDQDLFMYVSWENSDVPDASKHCCTPISPVIWCGKHGANFSRHVVLSFPQTMHGEKGQCKYRVLRSDTDVTQPTSWVDVTTTKETCLIPIDNRCLLLVDHFTGYSVGAECKPDSIKTLQVGVYGDILTPNDDLYQFKVRMWSEGSPSPKQSHENELDDVRKLDTINNGEPICVNVTKTINGWELDETYQEVQFSHFWNAYSESVTFAAMKTKQGPVSFFSTLEVYQKNTEHPGNKRIFKPIVKPKDQEPKMNDENFNNDTADDVFLKVEKRLKPGNRLCNVLPASVAQQLSLRLDPISPNGNDWRLFAENVGLSNDLITWILTRSDSPTLTVLDVVAAMFKEKTPQMLLVYFGNMKHDLCHQIVQSHISTNITVPHGNHLSSLDIEMGNLKIALQEADPDETFRKGSGSSRESGYSSPTCSKSSRETLNADDMLKSEENLLLSQTKTEVPYCTNVCIEPDRVTFSVNDPDQVV